MTGPFLGYLTSLLFLVCILASYLNYGLYHKSWLPLPTISETWTFAPFTYVSRVVVGVGSTLLIALHVIIYESSKLKKGASGLLFVGVASSACLAIVAAVCVDEHAPQCLGSAQWHDSTAVLFFLLMDMYMMALNARDEEEEDGGMLRASLGMSLLSKARFLTLMGMNLGPTIAVFEYIQISAILQFMLSYLITKAGNYRLGLIRTSLQPQALEGDLESALLRKKSAPGLLVDASVSGLIVVLVTIMLGVVVVFFPLIVSLSRDSTPDKGFFLPDLSSTFVLPPGNYIARLVGVQGCAAWMIAVLAMRWSVFPEIRSVNKEEQEQPWRDFATNNLAVLMALLAGVALSLTLCVSTLEHMSTHQFLTGFFFACYNGFQLILTAQINPDGLDPSSNARGTWLFLSTAISTLAKTRLAFQVGYYRLDDAIFNVLELADVLSMLSFVAVLAWFGSTALSGRIALAVFRYEE